MEINDLLGIFTPGAGQVITQARERAASSVTPVHLLSSLLDQGGRGVWRDSLESIGVELEIIREHVDRVPIFHPTRKPKERRLLQLDSAGARVIELSLREAKRLGQVRPGCEALLLGLIGQGDERAGGILSGAGANLERTRRAVECLLGEKILRSVRNLTQAVIDGELDPVIGRDQEIDRILHILVRDPLHIPVLVGKQSVGKTSIVHGLAQRIAANRVPEEFSAIQVIDLNTSDMRGERNSPASYALADLAQRSALVFLDGGQLPLLADCPLLVRSGIRIIGTAVSKPKIPLSSRQLVPIAIGEVSVGQAIQILESRRTQIEERYRLTVTNDALTLAPTYVKERTLGLLPGSAIELLDEAATLGYVRGLGSIDATTVAEAVANRLGITIEKVEKAPSAQPPTAKVEHDPQIWEMS